VIGVELQRRPAGAEPWQPPSVCPVCGTNVVRAEDEAALRCPNARCPGRLKALVFHFTRRTTMDVDRLGWALIDQLVEAGLLRDSSDVFALTEPDKRAKLLALERMGERSVDKLLESVDHARTSRTLAQLLSGLGIPLVGSVAARLIAERYRNLRTLLDTPPEQLEAALSEIRGIGPKIAESVKSFFADEVQRATVERLLALGVVANQPERSAEEIGAAASGPLAGKSFCVTGTLSRPREEIHALIRAAGGEVHDSVRKGTTFLVAGAKVGQSKLTAAEKRGTKVLTEDELAAMLA
jgi:DNA ligase (NAD+)